MNFFSWQKNKSSSSRSRRLIIILKTPYTTTLSESTHTRLRTSEFHRRTVCYGPDVCDASSGSRDVKQRESLLHFFPASHSHELHWMSFCALLVQSVAVLAAVQGEHVLLLMQRKLNSECCRIRDHRKRAARGLMQILGSDTQQHVAVFDCRRLSIVHVQLIYHFKGVNYESVCMVGIHTDPGPCSLTFWFMAQTTQTHTHTHLMFCILPHTLASFPGTLPAIDPPRVDSLMVRRPSYSRHNRGVTPGSLL